MSSRGKAKNFSRAELKGISRELNISEEEASKLTRSGADILIKQVQLNKQIAERRDAQAKRTSSNLNTLRSPLFAKACELAGIEPTHRQASKWNMKRGLAWLKRNVAKRELAKEAKVAV